MKKFSTFAAALAVVSLFPLAGAAQQQAAQAPQAGTPERQARGQRAARPQLTDQQREQMRALHETERTAGEASRRELRELHGQLGKALSAAELDNGRINELRGAIVQKETALSSARLERRATLAGILTPEQRQAFGERGIGRMAGPDAGRGERRDRMRGQSARRGHNRAAVRMHRAPGARGQMMRQRGGDADLREQVKRLEAQVEELRKKIK